MNLSTFNSSFLKDSVTRSLVVALSLLSSYHVLVSTKIVKPSEGTNQEQSNFIKLQKYVYQDASTLKVVLVGSSIAAHLPIHSQDFPVINLGISGGSAQTGLEVVRRKHSKPKLLLIELNETIQKKVDAQTIDSLYNPFLYYLRMYFFMFRQEYQPVGTLISTATSIKHKLVVNDDLQNQRNKSSESHMNSALKNIVITQLFDKNTGVLSKNEKTLLRQESEYIKNEISQVEKDGVRVILFNVPGEQRIQKSVKQKQIQALIKELFPSNEFEWLPEPQSRHWRTSDGIHLVKSDAKDYAIFLRNQLLQFLPEKAREL